MYACRLGWNEAHTQTSYVTTQNWLRRLQHYAHAHVFMLCFVLILWILVFTLSLVSGVGVWLGAVSCRRWDWEWWGEREGSLPSFPPLLLLPKIKPRTTSPPSPSPSRWRRRRNPHPKLVSNLSGRYFLPSTPLPPPPSLLSLTPSSSHTHTHNTTTTCCLRVNLLGQPFQMATPADGPVEGGMRRREGACARRERRQRAVARLRLRLVRDASAHSG